MKTPSSAHIVTLMTASNPPEYFTIVKLNSSSRCYGYTWKFQAIIDLH